jgi:hypothetical protein
MCSRLPCFVLTGVALTGGLLAPVLGSLTIIIGGWLSAWAGGSLWPILARIILASVVRVLRLPGPPQHASLQLAVAPAQGNSSNERRINFYSRELNDKARDQLQMEANLRRAIDAGDQLLLYYQPKVLVENNQMVGVEAFVRWRKPDGSFVYPDLLRDVVSQTVTVVPVVTQPVERNRMAGRPDLLQVVKQVGVLIHRAAVYADVGAFHAGCNRTGPVDDVVGFTASAKAAPEDRATERMAAVYVVFFIMYLQWSLRLKSLLLDQR